MPLPSGALETPDPFKRNVETSSRAHRHLQSVADPSQALPNARRWRQHCPNRCCAGLPRPSQRTLLRRSTTGVVAGQESFVSTFNHARPQSGTGWLGSFAELPTRTRLVSYALPTPPTMFEMDAELHRQTTPSGPRAPLSCFRAAAVVAHHRHLRSTFVVVVPNSLSSPCRRSQNCQT
ncbi:hypothetical protein BKA81DRAFT_381051 [Phyllosticta paracitricarpa]